ncbi:MAG: ABC transporter permease [Lachnospiraceae bacterium]
MKKKRNFNLIFGCALAAGTLLFIIIGAAFTPYDPDAISTALRFAPPSAEHIMGCDHLGRDVFSRVLTGSGTTFFVVAATLVLGGSTGIAVGMIAGYKGGWLDQILMQLNDTILAFPSILLAMVFIAVLGPGKYNVILAFGIAFIPSFARIARSEVIREKEMDYIKSARLMGIRPLRVMFVHLLPNIRGTLLASLAIGFNNAVLAESTMSYLGIGVQPPDASLGRMLNEAQLYLFTAPWAALFPGAFVVLLILGYSLISDGIH